MTIHYCKNCKHLDRDGMFGIFCAVGGNNKNYNCSKYEEKEKLRFTIEVDDENFAQILDNNVQIGQYNVCKLLNKIVNENKQLREEIKDLNDVLARYEEKELKK